MAECEEGFAFATFRGAHSEDLTVARYNVINIIWRAGR